MHLSWLELGNFRPYEALRFEPTDGVNILVGANGAGKTSVLEAIGYLGMMRSFRGVPDAALVRDDADAALIRGGIAGAATETKVECELPAHGRRTILVNQKRPKRLTDVLLSIPVVAFLKLSQHFPSPVHHAVWQPGQAGHVHSVTLIGAPWSYAVQEDHVAILLSHRNREVAHPW